MPNTCSKTLAAAGLLVASWHPGCRPHPWPWSAPQGGATSRCPTSKDDRPVRPCVSREGWGWGSALMVEGDKGLYFASKKETEGLEEGKGGVLSGHPEPKAFLFITAPSGP